MAPPRTPSSSAKKKKSGPTKISIDFHDLAAKVTKGKGKGRGLAKANTAAASSPMTRTPSSKKKACATPTTPAKPRKLFFKFEYLSRSYEGFYSHAEFMEHAKQCLKHKYPFLPKILITSRAQTMWEAKMKEVMQEKTGSGTPVLQSAAKANFYNQAQKEKENVGQNVGGDGNRHLAPKNRQKPLIPFSSEESSVSAQDQDQFLDCSFSSTSPAAEVATVQKPPPPPPKAPSPAREARVNNKSNSTSSQQQQQQGQQGKRRLSRKKLIFPDDWEEELSCMNSTTNDENNNNNNNNSNSSSNMADVSGSSMEVEGSSSPPQKRSKSSSSSSDTNTNVKSVLSNDFIPLPSRQFHHQSQSSQSQSPQSTDDLHLMPPPSRTCGKLSSFSANASTSHPLTTTIEEVFDSSSSAADESSRAGIDKVTEKQDCSAGILFDETKDEEADDEASPSEEEEANDSIILVSSSNDSEAIVADGGGYKKSTTEEKEPPKFGALLSEPVIVDIGPEDDDYDDDDGY